MKKAILFLTLIMLISSASLSTINSPISSAKIKTLENGVGT